MSTIERARSNRAAEPRGERAAASVPGAGCRSCGAPLSLSFVDLGATPLCERFLSAEQLDEMEPFYPLHALVCERCWLVQLRQYVSPQEIFGEYAYFSSYSDSWLAHAREYCRTMIAQFGIGRHSQVVEVASNDGYLLQNFVLQDIPALGIEPAANVARAAVKNGIPTRVEFFGLRTAEALVEEGVAADLLIANNVLAHVPDLNDFVAGLARLLAPEGVLTLEFPHLTRLIEGNQFDTIYHEHFCYFSLLSAEHVLAQFGLTVCDVQELATHGGSLRLFVRHAASQPVVAAAVETLRQAERAAGLDTPSAYQQFAAQVARTKRELLTFLCEARRQGKSIAAYGAPGKGNTLFNYCGIRSDFIEYAVDRNPYKHGKFTPGTRIPIYAPERLAETKPDYILILPWNLRDEILSQLDFARDWGARFILAIPELTIC